MFSFCNTPAVNLANRKWLAKLGRNGEILDFSSKEYLFRILERCKPYSPCGLVFDLALQLGATRQYAMNAACASELFFAVCSYTDDIQDGDTTMYFEDTPQSIHINFMAQLFCLFSVRLAGMTHVRATPEDMNLAQAVFSAGSAMLTGQRKEILRETWDCTVYEEVARRIAGDQYSIHFRLAAHSARADVETWARLGKAYGTLLQLIVDQETGDPRLLVIKQRERGRLKDKLARELVEASASLSTAADNIAQALLQRCLKQKL